MHAHAETGQHRDQSGTEREAAREIKRLPPRPHAQQQAHERQGGRDPGNAERDETIIGDFQADLRRRRIRPQLRTQLADGVQKGGGGLVEVRGRTAQAGRASRQELLPRLPHQAGRVGFLVPFGVHQIRQGYPLLIVAALDRHDGQPLAHAVILVRPELDGQFQRLVLEHRQPFLLSAHQALGPMHKRAFGRRVGELDLGLAQGQRRNELFVFGQPERLPQRQEIDAQQRGLVPPVGPMLLEVAGRHAAAVARVRARGTIPTLPVEQQDEVQRGGIQPLAALGIRQARFVGQRSEGLPSQGVQRLLTPAVLDRQVAPLVPVEDLTVGRPSRRTQRPTEAVRRGGEYTFA